MSECVVRVDMPTDNCGIAINSFGVLYCPIKRGVVCNIEYKKEPPAWCPIICALPENHGRLVDADALHKIAWPVKDHTGRIEECVQIRDLYKAPTIVPATE